MAARSHMSALGYAIIFGVLLVLTGLTLVLSYVDLGLASVPIALTIASTKALLVALFFMHLVEQRASNRIVAATGVAFVALIVGLMVLDVDTRPGLQGEVQPRPEPLPPAQRGVEPTDRP